MPAHTKLDNFTLAYIECALWASNDDDGEPLDRDYSADDIDADSLASMVKDCADFQACYADLLSDADYEREQWNNAEMAGHDFWLTRNYHGAGFWDRQPGPVGDKLTLAAHSYGESDLYIGDDGKLYV